jgi:hypothetical protein
VPISVPVVTWIVIIYRTFGMTEKLPNSWLLVVSRTATGGLGMAVAVVILRDVNNDREHLTEIQDCITIAYRPLSCASDRVSQGPAAYRLAVLS